MINVIIYDPNLNRLTEYFTNEKVTFDSVSRLISGAGASHRCKLKHSKKDIRKMTSIKNCKEFDEVDDSASVQDLKGEEQCLKDMTKLDEIWNKEPISLP